jgi:signal transduction histidine kinase/DNA-binding response OmpR family regulator
MKIKTKLIIGFALILGLLVGITSFGYERLTQMNDTMNHFYANRFEKVKAAVSVRAEVNSSARVISDMLLRDKDPKQSIEEITRMLTAAGQEYKALGKQQMDPAEQQMYNGIIKTSDRYVESLKTFIQLVNQGKMGEAGTVYSNSLRTDQQDVIDSMDGLVKFQEAALNQEMTEAKSLYDRSVQMVAILTVAGLLLGLVIVLWVFPSINKGLNLLGRMADLFSKGRLRGFAKYEIKSQDELGALARLFKQIALDMQTKNERESMLYAVQQRQSRIDAQMVRVTELLTPMTDAKSVAQSFISEFAPIVGATYGVVYLAHPDSKERRLELSGSYAGMGAGGGIPEMQNSILYGEGLVGQCAIAGKQIVIEGVPEGYIQITSGLGASDPKEIILQPILSDDEVIGVVELASIKTFPNDDRELLESLSGKFATIVNNIRSRQRVEELLRESQAMTEELQAQSEELITQQEELRQTNDKLEGQRNNLKHSEQRLQAQQEELEHTNQELKIKTLALEEQISRIESQNRQIAEANSQLEQQALQLALTSKYKSEFLANMSHELRTPLNSLLILSEFLAENKEGNLTEKQREYMRTIHYSGNDLLKMIDEILDLSKVDAGKMDIHPEWMAIGDIKSFLEHMYAPVAAQKQLSFSVEVDGDIPDAVWTDGHRLKQILRNLLSNAVKFTHSGSVELCMRRPNEQELQSPLHQTGVPYVGFAVKDTGIGIPTDKSELIFEAFRQADGTTSRKYGGTGLGLTISRELARLMGGWIHLETEPGQGSTFTLILPERMADRPALPEENMRKSASDQAAAASEAAFGLNSTPFFYKPDRAEQGKAEENTSTENRPQDDRDSVKEGEHVLLIVEDDVNFAKVLLEMAHSRGFKAVIALQGDEGLELAKSLKPQGVILDIQLPVTDGWSILNELKSDPDTRHIPVHVISVTEETSQGLRMGAIDHLQKPATREQLEKVFENISTVLERVPKQLLLIQHDEEQREKLSNLISFDDVTVTAVPDADSAWSKLQDEVFDCIVLDSSLPDGGGLSFLHRIQRSSTLRRLPIILHGRNEDEDQETMNKFRRLANSIVLKDVKSPERLLEETALFLHRVEANLPEDQRKMLSKLHKPEGAFENKKILLVDDDVRNVFALSSVLEHRQMTVFYAENGVDALKKLEEEADIDLVLMDIMMPEMDGYEAMRRMREHAEWSKIPIIALTAKAMKDDRNKCIEAGASDYITKPVNTDQLLSLMRVWLYR